MAQMSTQEMIDAMQRIIEGNLRNWDTPDGSHMNADKIKEKIDELTKGMDDDIQFLSDYADFIRNEIQTAQLRGATQDEIDQLNEDLAECLEEKLKVERAKLREEKKVKKKARDDAYSAVSGGRSDRITRQGYDLQKIGNGIQNLLGNGKIGKTAGFLPKLAGKAMTKMAGPIGLAVSAFEMGIDKMCEYMVLGTEKYLRNLNAVTTVQINEWQAALASWTNSMQGAYEAQGLKSQNISASLDAGYGNELAQMKWLHSWTNWIPVWGNINHYQERALELQAQIDKADLETAQKTILKVQDFAKLTDDYLNKQDAAIHNYQRIASLSEAQTATFEKEMLRRGESFAELGKTIEDALKIQIGVQAQSGRAINYSETDYKKSMATSDLVGEDNLQAFQAEMVLFGGSVEDAADIMYDTYRDAAKMALSTQKVMKNVTSNLKLAEKYNFKNGVKGLSELAKWSENVRFNLGSLGGMIEKTLGGGLSGTIEQSAKLQVLGGNFALNANPFGLLYDSLADPESYAKRVQDMFTGLGTVDSKTGETRFSPSEVIRMRAAADALGMSAEDAMNMARESNKKDIVLNQMDAAQLSLSQKESVANMATFNKETQRFEVKMLDGSSKGVNEVTAADLTNGQLLSSNNEENSIAYMRSTMSFTQNIAANTAKISALLGGGLFDDYSDTVQQSINTTYEGFQQNQQDINNAVQAAHAQAVESQKEMFTGLSGIDAEFIKANMTISTIASRADSFYQNCLAELQRMQADKIEAANKVERRTNQLNDTYSTAVNGESGYFDNFGKSQDLITARAKYWSAKGDDDFANGDVLGGAWNKFTAFSNQTLGRGLTAVGNLFGFKGNVFDGDWSHVGFDDGVISGEGRPMTVASTLVTPIRDGAITANGSPMSIPAATVTPIRDGAIAQTDPNDVGLFAKIGGPFDKLFDGVFAKITHVYDLLSGDNNQGMPMATPLRSLQQSGAAFNSQYDERSISDAIMHIDDREPMSVANQPVLLLDKIIGNSGQSGIAERIAASAPPEITPLEPLGSNSLSVIENSVPRGQGCEYGVKNAGDHEMKHTFDPITINGELKLSSSDSSQSINLIDHLQRNPQLLHTLTQMIQKQIVQTINGGRGDMSNPNMWSLV